MTGFVDWLRLFISHYLALEYIIIFFVAGFFGEFGIIALGFLSAQGVLPLFPFLALSFLGVFFSNAFWFLLGRTAFFDKIISHRYTHKTISTIAQAVSRSSRGNHFLSFFIIKFMTGIRVLFIMYMSRTGMELKKFMYYDIVAVFVWLAVVVPIGFISGLGFSYLAKVFENLYSAVGFVLLFLVSMFVVQTWFKKTLTEESA